MKSYKYNVAEIEKIVNACAAQDAVARRKIRSVAYRAIISPDGLEVSTTATNDQKSASANSCLLVQAWPGADAVTMVSYRLLGAVRTELPSVPSQFEFAVDWSAEVGLSQRDPVILHVIHDDVPVFFNYAVSHHLGKKRDYFSLDVEDLNDRYSQFTQRLCEHFMLVAQFHAKVDQMSGVAA